MMTKVKPRIIEGGAIDDSSGMTMEQYSEIMKKQLGKEYIRFADNVIKKINPLEDSTVLEIGPGPGWAGINLLKKRKDLKLVGLEASPDMIRVASENAGREGFSDVKYIQGFGENMHQINDGQFDLVISRDSLHHWTEPDKVFKEIRRVLMSNGKLYIHDSRRDMSLFGRLIVAIASKFIPNNMGFYWKSSIAASYTPDEIKTMLSEISFNDWQVESDLLDLVIYRT
ncbi:MAG: class I SAM-dependent methyltransferase [Bacteroidales bacterium]|jgi:ubiquinone/menaquinone biosynthesis C-methylase UbiE|nr:class I SAM-dependent methyltransferase [Bacteroidales bacterium]